MPGPIAHSSICPTNDGQVLEVLRIQLLHSHRHKVLSIDLSAELVDLVGNVFGALGVGKCTLQPTMTA